MHRSLSCLRLWRQLLWTAALLIFSSCDMHHEMSSSPAVIATEAWTGPFEAKSADDLDAVDNVVSVELEAKAARVELATGQLVNMWTYNGAVPGPTIVANVGDLVRVKIKNSLPESTTIHWHGLRVPAAMDGAPAVQREIQPGESYTYEFVVPDSGTFWYHPHVRSDVQIERGLYGAIIVHDANDPKVDGDHLIVLDDVLLDDAWQIAEGDTMMEAMNGREGNLLLVNGHSRPILNVPAGSVQRLRFINTANARFFRLTVPNHPLVQIGADGALFEKALEKNEVYVVPGQRADVLIRLPTDEGASLGFQTRPYARGHGMNGGKTHDLYELRTTAPLATSTPFPSLSSNVADLPQADVTRQLKLEEQMMSGAMHGGHGGGGPTFSFNGQTYPKVTPLEARLGSVEQWSLINETMMDHPFHLHGFRFQVVQGAGIEPARRAWRDTINVPADSTVQIRMRLDEHPGTWMFHCHILEHAERGMMGELLVSE